MFTFTPLLGAHSASRSSQSILELDGGVKVLVDVGWDERFDTRQLAELEKHVSTLSFILLTHATTSHLGAFAHCCKHVPLFSQVPVYATSPVIAFGRTLLQDLYSSTPQAATFIPGSASPEDSSSTDDKLKSNILRQVPSFEEINKYFSVIVPLKYSQPHQPNASYFSAPVEGLTLTAYNAGHTLGGTIWHIHHGMESIVYAVDWHQARENVIAGAAWFGGVGGSEVIEQLRKPTALICSSVNGNKIALSGGRKARDEMLIGHIRSSLSKGGSVLLPTDSSARILELAWILEKVWQEGTADSVLKTAKVYMASKSAHATLRHARSLLEWMDDSIVREFEGDDDNTAKTHKRSGSKQTNGASKPSRPFEFKHIKIVERKAQLDRLLKNEGPRVIIASDLSLEWGYSKPIFESISQKAENLIILTEMYNKDNIESVGNAQTLSRWYQERVDGVALEKSIGGAQIEQVHAGGRQIILQDATKAPLDAAETKKYQQYVATLRQMQDSLIRADGREVGIAEDTIEDGDSSSSESEESDDEQQGRALNVSAALTHSSRNKAAVTDEDLGVTILIRKKGVHDYDVRNKRGRNAVFPYTHTRRKGDEFGDFIKPEDFLREEEKEAQEAQEENKAGGVLGQKRRWDDANKTKHDHSNKRQQVVRRDSGEDQVVEEGDGSDDSDSEPEGEVEHEGMQGPAKIVYTKKTINVNARLAFVDFAGLHDQRSLQMLIPLIGPKKLILIGGSSVETVALASDCRELLKMKASGAEDNTVSEIFTPLTGQTVDASVDTNAWIVKLSRDLAKKLQWQNVKNVGIVTITGQLRAEPLYSSEASEMTAAKKPKLGETETKIAGSQQEAAGSFEPILDAIPTSLAASIRTVSQPIHVGDLRLADLRRLMNAAGHAAEFRGEGTLLVDGMIAVKKLSSGKIIVEGTPVSTMLPASRYSSDSFTSVKRKIYEGLAVVAAG